MPSQAHNPKQNTESSVGLESNMDWESKTIGKFANLQH